MAGRSVVDREMRSSTLPVRTRYRLSSVVERGPPKPDADCSIQSAGANVYSLIRKSDGGTIRTTEMIATNVAVYIGSDPFLRLGLNGIKGSLGR